MIIDKELLFADGTWAPTATGDNVSPNVLDTSPLGGTPTANGGRDLGDGLNMYVVVTVVTTVTSGGSATVDFRFGTDSVAALSSYVTLASTGAIAKATLVAGYQAKLQVPSGSYKKYIGIVANIGTAVLTAGAFHVAIVKDQQNAKNYAGGYSIDV